MSAAAEALRQISAPVNLYFSRLIKKRHGWVAEVRWRSGDLTFLAYRSRVQRTVSKVMPGGVVRISGRERARAMALQTLEALSSLRPEVK